MLSVDQPGEDDEPIVDAYCPECAEREFGASRRVGTLGLTLVLLRRDTSMVKVL